MTAALRSDIIPKTLSFIPSASCPICPKEAAEIPPVSNTRSDMPTACAATPSSFFAIIILESTNTEDDEEDKEEAAKSALAAAAAAAAAGVERGAKCSDDAKAIVDVASKRF
mmetsp:Transcript_3305/g.6170  ORF Transcript_3305/g.6170 Transcript_3305/m.6170 type:complete len:112 (+) Transcript_3305:1260-1595(+)